MKKSVLATVCVAASLALAAPAWATGTPYKVKIGSLAASAGNQPFTATSSTALQLTASSGGQVSCSASSVPSSPVSTVTNSPTVNVLDLMSFAKVDATGCAGSNVGGSVTFFSPGGWKLHGISGATAARTSSLSNAPAVSAASADIVAVHVDDIVFQVSNLACKFVVKGKADGTYREDTRTLTLAESGFDGDLKVQSGASCGSRVVTGNAVDLSGKYVLTVAGGLNVNIKP